MTPSKRALVSRIRHPLLWVAVVALGLRLFQLTYHSLWFDEAVSAFWAGKGSGELWRVGLALVQDKHPPFYYWLLHLWTQLFGPGDTAVRSLGVMIGALAVLPVYGLGRLLGGRRAGAIAALLVALNPFLVWYSQEARMFMPATTFICAGLYGLLAGWEAARAGRSPSRRVLLWVTTAAGFAAALYSYLFSAFVLPVAGAWLVVLWLGERRTPGALRRLVSGGTALAATALLYLPLALAAWRVSGSESTPGQPFAGLTVALPRLLLVYSAGWPAWPATALNVLCGAVAMLALFGILCGTRALRDNRVAGAESVSLGSTPAGGWLLALWLLIPLAIGGALQARDNAIFRETRYFIFLVPALCLAWARALAWLWARRPAASLALLALLLGVTIAALPALWSPANRREAWREAAAFIEAHAGPYDAVLVQPDYVDVAFRRYYSGPQPVYVPFREMIDDPARVEAPLSGLSGFEAVWLVQSHHRELDPGDMVAGWFGARFPQITEVFPSGIVIKAYLQRYRTGFLPEGAPMLPGAAAIGTGIRLISCTFTPDSLRATDDLLHPPSGWVHVRTYWTADTPVANDLPPSVRLVDAQGQVWGDRLARQGDTFNLWPTSRWLPGEVVRADFDVNLNPITPEGSYRLVVRLGEEAEVTCGTVAVVP